MTRDHDGKRRYSLGRRTYVAVPRPIGSGGREGQLGIIELPDERDKEKESLPVDMAEEANRENQRKKTLRGDESALTNLKRGGEERSSR
jgi:hypothetical protein